MGPSNRESSRLQCGMGEQTVFSASSTSGSSTNEKSSAVSVIAGVSVDSSWIELVCVSDGMI